MKGFTANDGKEMLVILGVFTLGYVGYQAAKAIASGVNTVGGFFTGLFGVDGAYNPENNATDLAGNVVNTYKRIGGVSGWVLAAANNGLGGVPATVDEQIGSWTDWLTGTHSDSNPDSATSSSDPVSGVVFEDRLRKPSSKTFGTLATNSATHEQSYAIQSASSRPHSSGPNAAYAHAYDSSPPDPTYTMNLLLLNPKLGLKGN